MIPKSLTIKGLYSYQSEQTIDFSQLAEATVFGIFGKVGAGKSSILEAIMYALYGEVERLDTKGRSYNMMNLSSTDLLILFEFEVADKFYLSKTTGRRNSKRFEDVKIERPLFFERKDDILIPLSIPTAETLLKLKAEDFTKTIIIPQGTFQAFLQLGETERARMMRELFGLNRFELDPNAKILQERNDTEMMVLQNQVAALGEIEPSQLKEKNAQLIDIQKIVKKSQTLLDKRRREETDMEKLKNDFAELKILRGHLTVLSEKEKAVLELENQINLFELATINFKNSIDNKKQTETNLLKTQSELTNKRTQLAKNAADTEGVVLDLEKIKLQFDNRDLLKKQSADLRLFAKIRELETAAETHLARIEKGKTCLQDKQTELQQLKNTAAKQQTERQQLATTLPNWLELNALKDWFSVDYANENEVNRLKSESVQWAEKLEGIETAKVGLVRTVLPPFDIRLPDTVKISEALAAVKNKIATRKTEEANAQHNLMHLSATAKLEALAESLADDEPCPLCGATHHPTPLSISEVKSEILHLNKLLTQIKNDLKSLDNFENQLQTMLLNFNNDNEQSRKIELELKNAEQKHRLHNSQFNWQNFDKTNPYSVEQAIENGILIQKNIEKLDNEIQQNRVNQDKANGDFDRYKTALSELEKSQSAVSASMQTLILEAQVLKLNDFAELDKTAFENKALAIDNQYISIENQHQNLEKKARELAENAAILRGSLEVLTTAENRFLSELKALDIDLEQRLLASEFNNLNEVELIFELNKNKDLIKTKEEITNFKTELLTAQVREKDFARKLDGKMYDIDQHLVLINENQKLVTEIENNNELIGELKSQIVDLKNKLEQLKGWNQRLKELKDRAENLKILRGLFQRSGFVNYASSVFLQSICAAANERFMLLTSQQLQLEITENNNFIIRDLANRGQTRDVRTLSGGQTFQAALSLALALSDHIQNREQAKQRFFFMDEGFGSLDRESLQIVFETLKALRKEQRIVGIISHLEDLQQEIERYILVERDEQTGSFARPF